jgi:purine-nucleoside phosphorylase
MVAVTCTQLLDAAGRRRPRIAFIFGSGLGDLDARLRDVVAVPFLDVPGLTTTSVSGHKGYMLLGDWAGVPVLVFSGRLHYYEGHAWRGVTQPIHIVRDLGIDTLMATNAAGGIRDDLVPGTLMALADHQDWTKPCWWREPGPGGLGATRPSPYDPALRDRLQAAASALGFALPAGLYSQVTGPCYETKAEIRALRQCGADAVGMSTAREIQVAHSLGLRCAAISCITNRAAGLSGGPIHHGEVLDAAAAMRERLAMLLEEFLRREFSR